MKVHELKCWPVYFDRIHDGTKRFEIRNNDRDFQTGDRIILREWDPGTGQYTDSRVVSFNISYVLHDHEGLYSGFVILQLSDIFDTNDNKIRDVI